MPIMQDVPGDILPSGHFLPLLPGGTNLIISVQTTYGGTSEHRPVTAEI